MPRPALKKQLDNCCHSERSEESRSRGRDPRFAQGDSGGGARRHEGSLFGSGAREHALAWKASHPRGGRSCSSRPGNPGAAQVAENIPISAEDAPSLGAFALERQIDLVIVGPEGPLAAGVSDALRAMGIQVFGPSQAAARIESSKAFAKAFMARHGIPGAAITNL